MKTTRTVDRHRFELLKRGVRNLTASGWIGDPMVIEDGRLRLKAFRAFPAPRLP